MHDVMVGIEHHRDTAAHAYLMNLSGAVRVLVVFQAQPGADAVGQGRDLSYQRVRAVSFAAMNLKQRPGRPGLLQQIHDVGVHLQYLDAVRHDAGRVRAEHDKLIRVHHQADILVERTLSHAGQHLLQRLQHFAADVFVSEWKDGRKNAVQGKTFARAKAQGTIERCDVVAVDFVEQVALLLLWEREQFLARYGSVTYVGRQGDADQAELRRHSLSHRWTKPESSSDGDSWLRA